LTAGIAVLDFGGPRGPEDLVPFLTALLEDVLPGPRWLKRASAPLLARARAGRVGPHYEAIGWSPLVPTHQRQVAALRELLGPGAPPVVSGMMFTPPTMDDAAAALRAAGVDRLVWLPMFPHPSLATTHAAFGFFRAALRRAGLDGLPTHAVEGYADHPDYIAALAATIRRGIAATPGPGDEPVHLVFSPHGLPVSWVARRGDRYPEHVRRSVDSVLAVLGFEGPVHVGWQSRLGPVRWLEPSTPQVLASIARSGGKRVCLVPVSFVSEHIETLHEIDVEYRKLAADLGIFHLHRAPALGTEPAFVRCLADLATRGLAELDHRGDTA
jgi:ferrochelatase